MKDLDNVTKESLVGETCLLGGTYPTKVSEFKILRFSEDFSYFKIRNMKEEEYWDDVDGYRFIECLSRKVNKDLLVNRQIEKGSLL